MIKPLKIFGLFFVFALVQCTSTGKTADTSSELYFIPQPMPDLSISIEIGARSDNPTDETTDLKNAFRYAYMEAILRGVNLTGVFGSDRVHPWPADAPESWSQNWSSKDSEYEVSSWGIPNLVLAIGNHEAVPSLSGTGKAFYPVFTIHDHILDMYGKSGGYGRANGVVGYGVPFEESFFFEGAAVQRFSRGRMIISREGSRFSFQPDTFNALLKNLGSEEKKTEFGGRTIPDEITNAFAYSWAYVYSENEDEWISDGSVNKVTFSKPWKLLAGSTEITINGFYYKSYNKTQNMLVLIDSEQLPPRAHRLSGAVLQVILSQKRIPGLKLERAMGPVSGTGLGRSLAAGFALYGPPLSNPLPLPNETEDNSDIFFMEAQRFARGWIVVKAEN